MDAPQLLSVVISTYNRSDALLAVLDGLFRQTDQNFEVIIADDGSREEHRLSIIESEVAKSLHAAYFWHPDVGFTLSKVRNRGVGLSKGDYLVFMDGDCVPEVDFIAQHRRLAQPGCFINGSRVLLSAQLTGRVLAGSEAIVGRSPAYWLKQRLLGNCNKITGLLRLPGWQGRVKRVFSLKGIRGCNMAMWRADFLLVNGFDESFTGWGHEDADMVQRLHNAGVMRKNGYCATEVFHLWHPEAGRDKASQNADVVEARSKTGQIRSALGYDQLRDHDDGITTSLG
jgi:glycosyltransferase involved in cell wall biosynthesis